MEVVFQIFILVICVVNNFVHGVGMVLLKRVRYTRCSTQIHLIFSLSLSEFVVSTLEISKIVLMLKLGGQHISVTYISMFQLSGLSLLVNMMMIYITLDRLIHFFLNIRYQLIITNHRTVILCVSTWIVCAMYSIISCMLFQMEMLDFSALYIYQYPAVEVVFLIVACLTYCYIAHKYCAHKRAHLQSRMKFKLYVPTLLVATYILLQVIPDIVYLFHVVLPKKDPSLLFIVIIWSVYMFSLLSDGLIYIFIQKNVRKELFTLLREINCQLSNGHDASTVTPNRTFVLTDTSF